LVRQDEGEHLTTELQTVRVTGSGKSRALILMLHGYAMGPDDLVPFAHSLRVPAEFYVPEGPVAAEPAGRAWWPIDQERRAIAISRGPRDLCEEHPEGADAARRALGALVSTLGAKHPDLPLVLLGFSQGGMLACDAHLRGVVDAAALVLLSSSRISVDEWAPLASRLKGLPVLISHGRLDDDLGFHAGEALRDFCAAAGAEATWVPFDGGHEIPLVVWRHVRRFLESVRR
jgi:phospholipase/carboxylesterase